MSGSVIKLLQKLDVAFKQDSESPGQVHVAAEDLELGELVHHLLLPGVFVVDGVQVADESAFLRERDDGVLQRAADESDDLVHLGQVEVHLADG